MTTIETIGGQSIQRLVQFRAKAGSDLLEFIEEAASSETIRAGVIVSGLGALQKAVFRNLKQFPSVYPVRHEDRLYLDIECPMELVSLGGWIAPKADGTVEIHAHFSASMVRDDTVVTLGGHLTRGTLCGIKVAVAILVLDPAAVSAELDMETKTHDIFFNRQPAST
ncbi:MAG: PCC domain-containing protein [Desulfobacterales bacterium]